MGSCLSARGVAVRQVRRLLPKWLSCPLQGLLVADATLADGFKRTRFLVLDEADRLLEPTFQVQSVPLHAGQCRCFDGCSITTTLVAVQGGAFFVITSV
jgi:hypothetical protein